MRRYRPVRRPLRGHESGGAALRPRERCRPPDLRSTRGRIVCHADARQSPAGVAKDYQAIKQLERDRAYDEQIQRSDAVNVIAQEGLPTLGRWSAATELISSRWHRRGFAP